MARKNAKKAKGNNNKSNKNSARWPEGMVSVPRNVHGLANATRVTLMYQESGITSASSGYATYRANDIFDPQAASSGVSLSGNQQPQYHDTWALLYNKYRVIGSTIKVQLINAATNPIPIFIEVSPEDTLTTTTNAAQASVARFAQYKIYANGPSTPAATFTRSMTTARINGVDEQQVLDNPNYQGQSFSSTPTDPWYWQIRFSSVDFATTPFVHMFIHITMDCVFSDPTQSDAND